MEMAVEFRNIRNTLDDVIKRVRLMVSLAAVAAEQMQKQFANTGAKVVMRLYYKPASAVADGSLLLLPETAPVPPNYRLATCDRLPISLAYENYWCWVRDRVQHLPILAMEG